MVWPCFEWPFLLTDQSAQLVCNLVFSWALRRSRMHTNGDLASAGGALGSVNGTSRMAPRALDEELAEMGLSQLGKSPDAMAHAYLRLALPGQSIADISLLAEYPHLQDIDLSDNALTVRFAAASVAFLCPVFLNPGLFVVSSGCECVG
jgi:hypothetical protein